MEAEGGSATALLEKDLMVVYWIVSLSSHMECFSVLDRDPDRAVVRAGINLDLRCEFIRRRVTSL